MRKFIKCSNEDCDATFGIQLSEKTIDIVRSGQQFTVTGKDYDIIGTCWKCDRKSSLTIEAGKLLEEGVEFKTEPTPRTPTPPADPTVLPPADPNEPQDPHEPVVPNPGEPLPPVEPPIVPEPKKYTKA